jgi:hypothetical protein
MSTYIPRVKPTGIATGWGCRMGGKEVKNNPGI